MVLQSATRLKVESNQFKLRRRQFTRLVLEVDLLRVWAQAYLQRITHKFWHSLLTWQLNLWLNWNPSGMLKFRQEWPHKGAAMGLAFFQVWCLWILQIMLNQVSKGNHIGHLLIIISHSSIKMKKERESLALVRIGWALQATKLNPRSKTAS